MYYSEKTQSAQFSDLNDFRGTMEPNEALEEFELYNRFARYYDLSYAWKEYDKESIQIINKLRAVKKSNGNKLLDVACGTGNLLAHLSGTFSCVGIDISKNMINLAKKRRYME